VTRQARLFPPLPAREGSASVLSVLLDVCLIVFLVKCLLAENRQEVVEDGVFVWAGRSAFVSSCAKGCRTMALVTPGVNGFGCSTALLLRAFIAILLSG
jgi:hypothetical protein